MKNLSNGNKLKVILFLMKEFYKDNLQLSKFKTQGLLTGFEEKECNFPAGIKINEVEFYLIKGIKIKVDIDSINIYLNKTLINRINLNNIKQFDCW